MVESVTFDNIYNNIDRSLGSALGRCEPCRINIQTLPKIVTNEDKITRTLNILFFFISFLFSKYLLWIIPATAV